MTPDKIGARFLALAVIGLVVYGRDIWWGFDGMKRNFSIGELADAVADIAMRQLRIPWTLDSTVPLPEGWEFVQHPEYKLVVDPRLPEGIAVAEPRLVRPGIIGFTGQPPDPPQTDEAT